MLCSMINGAKVQLAANCCQQGKKGLESIKIAHSCKSIPLQYIGKLFFSLVMI